MGLGKTIQSISFLHQLWKQPCTNIRGPHLIVAPLSLIRQWESEFSIWSPETNCIVLHGTSESREILLQNEFYFQPPFTPKAVAVNLKKKGIYKFDVVLTTYEMAMKEKGLFSKIKWEVFIIDEAHRLKNNSSKIFEMLQAIPREHCVMLTGTPLQNKTDELWALLHFADRKKFPVLAEFSEKFGDLRDAADVARLHNLLKPYLLRRIKEDVEKSLPPKEETIIEVFTPHCIHVCIF